MEYVLKTNALCKNYKNFKALTYYECSERSNLWLCR